MGIWDAFSGWRARESQESAKIPSDCGCQLYTCRGDITRGGISEGDISRCGTLKGGGMSSIGVSKRVM